MRTSNEIQERLDNIRKRMMYVEEEYKNRNIDISDYTEEIDFLESQKMMLEWVLNK